MGGPEPGGVSMSRLWRVPSTIAEYTLGTIIVMYQFAISRALEEQARLRREQVRR